MGGLETLRYFSNGNLSHPQLYGMGTKNLIFLTLKLGNNLDGKKRYRVANYVFVAKMFIIVVSNP